MDSLEKELDRARSLSVDELADAIETIGFECTNCGACCKADTCSSDGTVSDEQDGHHPKNGSIGESAHTATVFPDEIRRLVRRADYDWRDVARPMPYGLHDAGEGPRGETFEWALATSACGDCTFYDDADGQASPGRCTVYEDRPLICRTYPFSLALAGTSQPMGEAVDQEGLVRVHECEGVGRDIDPDEAFELASTLKERTVREIEEAIGVRDSYDPVDRDNHPVIVYDSEGAKTADGRPIE